MNLGELVGELYPGMDPSDDYEIALDDATGESYIEYWNETTMGPQPTVEELWAQSVPAMKERKKRELSETALDGVRGLFTTDKPQEEMLGLLCANLVGVMEASSGTTTAGVDESGSVGDTYRAMASGIDPKLSEVRDRFVYLFGKLGDVAAVPDTDDPATAQSKLDAIVL